MRKIFSLGLYIRLCTSKLTISAEVLKDERTTVINTFFSLSVSPSLHIQEFDANGVERHAAEDGNETVGLGTRKKIVVTSAVLQDTIGNVAVDGGKARGVHAT